MAASCAVAATAVWAAWRRSKQVGKLVQRADNGVELRFATIDDVDEILRLIKALAVVSADRYICRPAGSVHAPSPPLFSSLRSSVVAVRSPGGCGPIRLAILGLGFSMVSRPPISHFRASRPRASTARGAAVRKGAGRSRDRRGDARARRLRAGAGVRVPAHALRRRRAAVRLRAVLHVVLDVDGQVHVPRGGELSILVYMYIVYMYIYNAYICIMHKYV